MTPLLITAFVGLGLSGAGVLFWAVLLGRMQIMLARTRPVSVGLDLPAPAGTWPPLSIIVPAHNEQELIDGCAATLRAQDYADFEIIFVLDRCTDRTAEILAAHAAADPRVAIVTNEACPDGWAGKCWAAHLGARRARGRMLLFTDADTRFDPRLARTAVALAHARDVALLSLLSTLTFGRLFERVAQLAASMNLLMLYPIDRVRRSRRPRPFANGQFMLFRRDWYDRVGGHEAVKEMLLEDIAAARIVQRAGGTTAVVFAGDMLTCSMYESLADFQRGWKRIFIEACSRKPRRLREWGLRTLATGVALPVVQALTLAAAPLLALAEWPGLAAAMVATVAAGVVVQVAALHRSAIVAGAPRRAILLYPLGCLIVGRLMLSAARDLWRGHPVVWGGRRYVITPR